MYNHGLSGGVAEWSKAAVLKTVECNSSQGSNPCPTAIIPKRLRNAGPFFLQIPTTATLRLKRKMMHLGCIKPHKNNGLDIN